MRKNILLILIFALSSCAASSKLEFGEWSAIGYEGFLEKIDLAAGKGAINCGYHNLVTIEENRLVKAGLRCVKSAIREGRPFKFGIVRLPIDSYAYEVLIGKVDRTYEEAVFDIMIDGESPQQWIKACKKISMHWRLDGYTLAECESIKYENWP